MRNKYIKLLIMFLTLIAICFGVYFTYTYIKEKNGKGASADISEISTASATTYKDFSELTSISNDYSYSSLFYSKNTKIYVRPKSDSVITYYRTTQLTDNNVSPVVRLTNVGDEAEIIITNCAVDNENNLLDAVFTVKVLDFFGSSPEFTNRADFKIGSIGFNKGLQSHPKICDNAKDSADVVADCWEEDVIDYNDPIEFNLSTRRATVKVDLTYYKSLDIKNIEENKYTTPYSTAELSGKGVAYGEFDKSKSTVANITKVNSVYSDIDTMSQGDEPAGTLFNGAEGMAPINGSNTIYYNKTNKDQIFDYPEYNTTGYASLAEDSNGIYIDRYRFRYTDQNQNTISNTSGFWYGTIAEVLTTNLNGTYSFVYSGYICGIGFSFKSPTGYGKEDPVKKVSKEVVKPNETFYFEVSQYIPNNYYAKKLDFHEVYPNLNNNNMVSSLAFSDEIDNRLVIDANNIVVEDVNGNNLNAYYGVTVNNNVVVTTEKPAAATYYASPNAYNNIITLKIPVKYVGKVEKEITIPNRGLVALSIGNTPSTPVSTNEVEVTVKPIKLTYDCETNGGDATFTPTVYVMQAGEEADLSYLCKKPDNRFLGWSTTPDGDIIDKFIMPDEDAILYGRYDPYVCDMSISSSKYKIDETEKIIYVEKDETAENIKKNIKAVEKITVTETEVVVECKEQKVTYKISRYWLPKTGKKVIRYGLIIGTILVILAGLLYFINKIKNNK